MVRVIPATPRAAGAVRLTLSLPRAVRAQIARRGRVTARLRLGLSRAGASVAAGEARVSIAAPASRAMPGQWLGRRLGPWRTRPPLRARERRGLRMVESGGTWSAVVVR